MCVMHLDVPVFCWSYALVSNSKFQMLRYNVIFYGGEWSVLLMFVLRQVGRFCVFCSVMIREESWVYLILWDYCN